MGKLDVLFLIAHYVVSYLMSFLIADSVILMYLEKIWGFYTNILFYFNKKNLKPKPIYYFLTGFQKLDQHLQ